MYFAIASEAKREGIPFGGHVPRVVDPGEASDAGQRSIEHMDGIYAACTQRNARSSTANEEALLTGVFDRPRCEALVDRLQRNGTWLVPTSINFWDPVDVDLRRRRQYGPPLAGTPLRRASPPPLVVNVHHSMHRVQSFLTGTDISIRRVGIVPGVSLHEELALFVEMGSTPAEALKAAAVNPAKYADMLNEFGTIEKNKRADMVLVDADPLSDVRNASKISAIVLNGRVFDRTELDRLLAKGESAARNIRPTPFLSIRIRDVNASSRFAGNWNVNYPVPQPIIIGIFRQRRTERTLCGSPRAVMSHEIAGERNALDALAAAVGRHPCRFGLMRTLLTNCEGPRERIPNALDRQQTIATVSKVTRVLGD